MEEDESWNKYIHNGMHSGQDQQNVFELYSQDQEDSQIGYNNQMRPMSIPSSPEGEKEKGDTEIL
jgi:hypothetical protein